LLLECFHAGDHIPHPNCINKEKRAYMVSPKALPTWVVRDVKVWNEMFGQGGRRDLGLVL